MKNKYFQSILFVSMFLLFIFYKPNLASQEKVVIGMPGLNCREYPDINSKKLFSIPYKETVLVIEQDNNEVNINGLSGQWEKVKWKNKTGWVFNAYIKDQYAGIKTIFNLFNISPISDDELDSVINRNFPNYSNYFQTPSYDPKVKLTMFDQIPYLLPEDSIIVLSKNKIYSDKIKSLYFYLSEITGDLVKFNLYKTNGEREDLIFIKKSDLNSKPILIKKNMIKIDNNLISLLKEQIYNSNEKKDIKVMFSSERTKSPREEIDNNYYFISSTIPVINSSVKIIIMELFHKEDQFDGYEFVSIFINNKLVYIQNSSIFFIFSVDNIPYIYLKQWIPHSGYMCNSILKVVNQTLKYVAHDCPFTN